MFFPYISLSSQEANTIKVKESGYKGYIFPKEHFVFGVNYAEIKTRITPTLDDIKKAESILSDSINVITKRSQPYRYSSKPTINKRSLKKYKRQYIGFLTKNNEVVIWINLLKNKDITKEQLSLDIVTVLDGGANYWNIYINITRKEISYMYVNGVS